MKILTLLFLLLASSAYSQPVIRFIQINEDSGTISIQGSFPSAKGNVFVDNAELTVISRSDTLLVATIPDSGRGSIGGVEIEVDGKRTEPRYITQWNFQSEWFGRADRSSTDKDSAYVNLNLFFRFDLHSLCKNRFFGTNFSFQPIIRRSTCLQKWIQVLNTDPPIVTTFYDSNYTAAGLKLGELTNWATISAIVYPINTIVQFYDLLYPTIVQKYGIDTGTSSHPQSGTNWIQTWKPIIALFEPPAKALALAYQPKLINPSSNQKSVPARNTLFNWHSLNFADSIPMMDKYRLQVSTDTNFVTIILDTTINALYFVQPTLLYDTKYFWRVEGINSEGESEWSKHGRFFTESLSSVNTATQEESLLSINPNPCTDKITVTFDESVKEPMTFAIYDLLGRKVMEEKVVSEANASSFIIPLPSLPDGAYVLVCSDQGQKFVERFVVMKK